MFINCYDNTPSARLCLFNFPLLRLKSLTYVPEGRIQVFYFLSQHWRGPFFSHGALKMHILKAISVIFQFFFLFLLSPFLFLISESADLYPTSAGAKIFTTHWPSHNSQLHFLNVSVTFSSPGLLCASCHV